MCVRLIESLNHVDNPRTTGLVGRPGAGDFVENYPLRMRSADSIEIGVNIIFDKVRFLSAGEAIGCIIGREIVVINGHEISIGVYFGSMIAGGHCEEVTARTHPVQ